MRRDPNIHGVREIVLDESMDEQDRLLLNWLATRLEVRPNGTGAIAATQPRERNLILHRFAFARSRGLEVVPGRYLVRREGPYAAWLRARAKKQAEAAGTVGVPQ